MISTMVDRMLVADDMCASATEVAMAWKMQLDILAQGDVGSGVSLTVLDHVFFFFFQAEDGIRDLTVTGVQTCALPISAQLSTQPPTLNVARACFGNVQSRRLRRELRRGDAISAGQVRVSRLQVAHA